MDATVSESPGHAIRLDCSDEDVSITLLWEPVGPHHVLETKFSNGGAILDQRLIALKDGTIRDITESFMDQNSMEPREGVFEEPALGAACPACGSKDVVRYAKTVSNPDTIPIMPLYLCRSCAARSYHLTDEYLKRLAKRNPELFEAKDLTEFERNEERFIKELREYIARVFASKKILAIKP